MKYKFEDLIKILEISMKVFEATENAKYSKETKEIIGILSHFKDVELDNLNLEQRKKTKNIPKCNYENLYNIFLKLKTGQSLDDNEEKEIQVYKNRKKDLFLKLSEEGENWFLNLDNVNLESKSIDDLKLTYRVLTGNQMKNRKKSEILDEIRNAVYQKKYYRDLEKKFVKKK